MRASDRNPPVTPAVAGYKRMLGILWFALPFWLLASPRPPTDVTISQEALRLYTGMMFTFILVMGFGLFREWRWPVTASRALLVALMVGVIVGPRGRDAWVYAVDTAFVVAGVALAFGLIRIGPRPLGGPTRMQTFRDQPPREPRRRRDR